MNHARLLVIDAGTTGIRALVFDENLHVLGQSYSEFTQYHPLQDRVEQDATEIWQVAKGHCDAALAEAGLSPAEVTAIGITNQRATTVVWDRTTGDPVTPVIVWQDTRTAARVEELADDWAKRAYAHTGWSLAPVYSSLSLDWILSNVPEARRLADAGDLQFGTVDSWLIYRLTGCRRHVIAASNASVTGSYDLTRNEWYQEFLSALDLPLTMFPEVVADSGLLGTTAADVFGAAIPIRSAIADQHSALFAQNCRQPGQIKCTHGTGTFLDMNIGETLAIDTDSGINTLIAWRDEKSTNYALEGYAATTGAAVQWLRDGVRIIDSAADSEKLAASVVDNGGVYFVPALTGLSAPYWDSWARGTIFGITPGTTRGHLARATLEGIVFSLTDFMDAMAQISGHEVTSIATDGGASRNNLLMQIQADQLGVECVRPKNTEATAVGAALLAGLAAGVWADPEEAFALLETDATFTPQMDAETRRRNAERWAMAVSRTQGWAR